MDDCEADDAVKDCREVVAEARLLLATSGSFQYTLYLIVQAHTNW